MKSRGSIAFFRLIAGVVLLLGMAADGPCPAAVSCDAAADLNSTAQQTMDVWVEHSATKTFKTDTLPASPRTSVELHAARGEWESFQIAIRTSFDAIQDLTMTISDLVDGTQSIAASEISAYQVNYVPTHTGVDWPDVLLPLEAVDGNPVEQDQTQPIWITVKVPRDCVAGNYTGAVTLAPAGYQSVTIPIALEVWNFPIPVTPRCSTSFGVDREMAAAKHGMTDPAAIYHLSTVYYEFLLDHRISARDIPPYINETQYWDTAAAASYLSDPRMTSFRIPYLEGNDENLSNLLNYLKTNDYYSRGFFYPVDEPLYKSKYEQLWSAANRLADLDSTCRMVSPFFTGPEWSSSDTPYQHLTGDLGIWCPKLSLFSNTTYQQQYQERIDAGDEGWTYVCWTPGLPYPNLLVDMPAMYHRILPWMAKQYNSRGILYWNVSWWTFVSDPWFDMATVKDLSTECYGDGSLVYPGRRSDVDLVDGPVSSIRLEVLRDALEDYDYLCMVESCYSASRMNGYLGQMISSETRFETDPWAMEAIRIAMGDDIDDTYSSAKFPDGFQPVYRKNVLFSDGFESGNLTARGWTNSGGAVTTTSETVYAGTYSAVLSNSESLTKAIDTEGYDNIQLIYTRKTDDVLVFYAEWYDGSSWRMLESQSGAGGYEQKVFVLPAGASDNPDFQIRFRRSQNTGSSTDAYLDHVKVTGESIPVKVNVAPQAAYGYPTDWPYAPGLWADPGCTMLNDGDATNLVAPEYYGDICVIFDLGKDMELWELTALASDNQYNKLSEVTFYANTETQGGWTTWAGVQTANWSQQISEVDKTESIWTVGTGILATPITARYVAMRTYATEYPSIKAVSEIEIYVKPMEDQIAGDANGDGMVDVGDLGILAANYGTTSGATWAKGDFNGDGTVDVGDLGILAANYGTGTSGGDWDADDAGVFGVTVAEEDSEEESGSLFCSGYGVPLIAGLMLIGLMLVKMNE